MENAENTVIKSESFSQEIKLKELYLHIAEYNTLTTRSTNVLNIQFVLLTIIMALVGVLWYNWKASYYYNYIIIWGSLLGAQIISIINVSMSYENYNIICYIESVLKPKIVVLIKNESFWGYEPYLMSKRIKRVRNEWTLMGDFLWVMVDVVALSAATIYRSKDFTIYDGVGLFINLILLCIIIVQTYHVSKMRLNNWKS